MIQRLSAARVVGRYVEDYGPEVHLPQWQGQAA